MRIPSDLQEADRILTSYGRWAMDRWKKQHCASIEHRYVPPRDSETRREPREVLMPDFSAIDVQRTLLRVPLQYGRVLQAEYIPGRLPVAAVKRMWRLNGTMWMNTHLAGLRMFANNWRLHGPANSA